MDETEEGEKEPYPNVKAQVFIFDGFDIKSDCRNRGNSVPEFEFVKDCFGKEARQKNSNN